MTIRLRTLLLLALAVAILGGAVAFLFVRLGLYDLAATRQHTAPVFKLLDYAMRRSVQAHADDTRSPPPDLENPARIREGAAHFRAHCLQCHGAPGVAPDALAFGLRPAPANLLPAGRNWKPKEIFWVVKHGIKMTGMPAWTYRLDDAQIWAVVAFVRRMPKLTPREYAELAATLPEHQRPEAHANAATAPRAGDVEAGRRAAAQYLCATCHSIPGLVSAEQQVGPPLDGIARRTFIGGVIANTPENMVRWLKNPQEVDPLSAMPPLGLSDQDARDIAAFLYTLDRVAHN
jgi:mono/diheme cytochrome c family protein